MSELILLKSNEDITVKSSATSCYLYRIGAGSVTSGEYIDLENASRLNRIAEEVRDAYAQWVYSLKETVADAGLTVEQLSLFFLTDLSCKRSEFFETFDQICNLLYLHERLSSVQLDNARLIGVDHAFADGFRSVFPETQVTIEQRASVEVGTIRRLMADSLYLMRALGVWTINLTACKTSSQPLAQTNRAYLSFYPQMFDHLGRETKYGTYCRETRLLAVTVFTDGIHQKISVAGYRKFVLQAEKKGMKVLDRDLRILDIVQGVKWAARCWMWYWRVCSVNYVFKNIDVSGFVKMELRFSISRITRLCVLKGIFFRFFREAQLDEVYYYPFEYPFGRMISWVAKLASPSTKRTGFQMSVVSDRRLEQFLAPGEASVDPPFYNRVPVPDRILAEDARAARAYRAVGYQNVELMKKVYRYEYLTGICVQRRDGWCLVAPGLHDGEVVLELLRGQIDRHPEKTYLIKPHPRADNSYLQRWSNQANIRISDAPVEELLGIVSEVFVTYSSVGLEAKQLGLSVTVLNVPGRVNPSPLLDLPERI